MMEAYIWYKNGDHPEDNCTFIGEGENKFLSEGKVVRYFRDPGIPGDELCSRCDFFFTMHGWIDKPCGGQMVCPGDIIIKNAAGEWEAYHKDREYNNKRQMESVKVCQDTINIDSK